MASSGVLRVGVAEAGQPRQPRVQFIGNPDGADTLILENRYAGPLALQWAESDIQVGTGLIGQAIGSNFHIPALSRCTIPWPSEFGANVSAMTIQLGDVQFDNATAISNQVDFRQSDVRFWWLDCHATEFRYDHLFPESSRILVARQSNVAQAGPHQADIVIGGGNITNFGGIAAPVCMVKSLLGEVAGPPVNLSPEARILRMWVRVLQGSALLSDLELTPSYNLGNGNSFYPFGSTAASTTEHNVAGPFPCPGAVGCIVDIDGAAAASGLLTARIYEVGVPLD